MKNKSKASKLSLVILLMAVALPSGVFAQSVGIFGSYIGINANNSGNSWYGAQEWGTDLQNFNGANLGNFDLSAGSLTISGFQVQTFKAGGGDITGANLLYRVYQQGSTAGGFNTVNAGFIANAPFTAAQGSSAGGGGDQNWGLNPPGSYANLLGGISLAGTYNVEIYFEATSPQGTQFSNNGGANYIASFTTVPEPSSASLMALGTAGLLALRRRRNS